MEAKLCNLPCRRWDDLVEEPVARPTRPHATRRFSKAIAASYLMDSTDPTRLVCSDQSQEEVRAMLLRNRSHIKAYGPLGDGTKEAALPVSVPSQRRLRSGDSVALRRKPRKKRPLSSIAPVAPIVVDVTEKYDKWLSAAAKGAKVSAAVPQNVAHLSEVLCEMEAVAPVQVLCASEVQRAHNKGVYEERTLELGLVRTERRMRVLGGDAVWLREERAVCVMQRSVRCWLARQERSARSEVREAHRRDVTRCAQEEGLRAARKKRVVTQYDKRFAAALRLQRAGRGGAGRAQYRQLRFELECRTFALQSRAATLVASFVRTLLSVRLRQARHLDVVAQAWHACNQAAALIQKEYTRGCERSRRRAQTRQLCAMRGVNLQRWGYHCLGRYAHEARRMRAVLMQQRAGSGGGAGGTAAAVLQRAWRSHCSRRHMARLRADRSLNCPSAGDDVSQESLHAARMVQKMWRRVCA